MQSQLTARFCSSGRYGKDRRRERRRPLPSTAYMWFIPFMSIPFTRDASPTRACVRGPRPPPFRFQVDSSSSGLLDLDTMSGSSPAPASRACRLFNRATGDSLPPRSAWRRGPAAGPEAGRWAPGFASAARQPNDSTKFGRSRAGRPRRRARLTDERCDLEVQPVACILIGRDSVVRDFALILVKLGRIERVDPVDGEPLLDSDDVGDLEVTDEASREERDPAVLRDDVGHISEGSILCEVAAGTFDHCARLEPAETSAISADFRAILEQARLRLEVDDTGRAITILRGERAGDQLDGRGDPGVEGGAEATDALGDDDAVEAILEVGVFVANVDRAIAVLGDSRGLKQRFVELKVRSAWLLLERLAVERVLAGSQRRSDGVAGDVQTPSCDDDVGLRLARRLGDRHVSSR